MAKVLILEDEIAIITLLKRMLTSAGHELTTAAEGGDALRAAQGGTFDVILSDLNMPGTPSGMDLLKAVRDAHPTTPIVVVSGYAAADIIDACKSIGITEFLPKPFEMMYVRQLVARLATKPAG